MQLLLQINNIFITIILLIDHWDDIPSDENRRILMKNHVAKVNLFIYQTS